MMIKKLNKIPDYVTLAITPTAKKLGQIQQSRLLIIRVMNFTLMRNIDRKNNSLVGDNTNKGYITDD